MKLAAKWKPDCQGKQDYDAPILEISTRYWPRGGGFHVLDRGEWQGNESRPEIKPSAHASLLINGGPEALAELEVEADTEAEVKVAVERWAQEQMDRAVKVLRAEFGR